MSYTMPFGKYKGTPVEEVPLRALEYYLEWDQIRPETKRAIEQEMARRGQKVDLKVEPDTRPDIPFRPAAPVDKIRLCALDLVNVGAQALLDRYPARAAIITAAVALLRDGLMTPAPVAAPPEDENDPVPF